MTKEGFILYKSFYEPIKHLSNEKKGILFSAIFEYQISGEEIVLPCELKMAFEFFKNQFRLDYQKYEKRVERNKENGKKGGRPKSENNPNNPLGFYEPKKADKDKDKEKEKDKDNVKVVKNIKGEYNNVYLTDKNYQKLLGIIMHKQTLDDLINQLSENIAEGKEEDYEENKPEAHFIRLKKYWEYRRKNPDKFKDNKETPYNAYA